MNKVKSFSDFKIETNRFTGKSIEIDELIDNEILIMAYKIGPSKYPGKGNDLLLTLQIKYEDVERVLFTGSVILQEQCIQVTETGEFPFKAKIIKLKPKGFKFI